MHDFLAILFELKKKLRSAIDSILTDYYVEKNIYISNVNIV